MSTNNVSSVTRPPRDEALYSQSVVYWAVRARQACRRSNLIYRLFHSLGVGSTSAKVSMEEDELTSGDW